MGGEEAGGDRRTEERGPKESVEEGKEAGAAGGEKAGGATPLWGSGVGYGGWL